jgi:hypothetical protein
MNPKGTELFHFPGRKSENPVVESMGNTQKTPIAVGAIGNYWAIRPLCRKREKEEPGRVPGREADQ